MMTQSAFSRSTRAAALLLAFGGLTACDDNGTAPRDVLEPEEIAGLYAVCQLVFDPAGSVLPAVDIREAAFEFPGGFRDPLIGIDPNTQRTLELTYVPKGQVNDQELRGNYTIRGMTTVELRFNATSVDPRSLLVPNNHRMDFEFHDGPPRLTMGSSSQYNVDRAAYVELSGEEPQNLPEAIAGVLIADFRSAGCGE